MKAAKTKLCAALLLSVCGGILFWDDCRYERELIAKAHELEGIPMTQSLNRKDANGVPYYKNERAAARLPLLAADAMAIGEGTYGESVFPRLSLYERLSITVQNFLAEKFEIP